MDMGQWATREAWPRRHGRRALRWVWKQQPWCIHPAYQSKSIRTCPKVTRKEDFSPLPHLLSSSYAVMMCCRVLLGRRGQKARPHSWPGQKQELHTEGLLCIANAADRGVLSDGLRSGTSRLLTSRLLSPRFVPLYRSNP